MKPNSRPKADRQTILDHAKAMWEKERVGLELPDMFLVGVPGYYWQSMGNPNANDRGIYDDAIFLVSPHVFASFNANTDPSRFKKGVASLLPGVHPYRPGNHGQSRPGGGYPAFRPKTKGEMLPVKRDGEEQVPSKRPGVAINIHRGGWNTTSSEGCQTLHPSQWDGFHSLVIGEMKRNGMTWFEYVLLEPGAIT